MLTVHHLNNSRSQRVLWLLEELGLDYTVVRYQRDAKTMLAPDALRAVHPLGKSPVIQDAASETRKPTRDATSSGEPRRFIGYPAAACSSPAATSAAPFRIVAPNVMPIPP